MSAAQRKRIVILGSGFAGLYAAIALAFGVLIVFCVVAGSAWIMGDLASNMMEDAPAGAVMRH